MFLPFKQEVVNYNFNDFDIYSGDKFIGMIKPDGGLFECFLGHILALQFGVFVIFFMFIEIGY